MQIEEIEDKIIRKLLKGKSECIDVINENSKAIQAHLKDQKNPFHIKEFVKKLNVIIIEELSKFKLVEKVLRHELLCDVLEEFRNSDVLINAFKKMKTDAVKWLMKMDMNYFVQNEEGTTALMQAAEFTLYTSAMEEMIKQNEEIVYILNNNGENALFYVTNEKSYKVLCDTKIDFNCINNNGENIFINICKRKHYEFFKDILNRVEDVDYISGDGRTASMYLVENGRFNELKEIYKREPNLDFRNNKGETALSILLTKFKEYYENKKFSSIRIYVYTLYVLLRYGCNFNISIDEEGNTPIMFFLMIGDYYSTTLLLERCEGLDVTIKNKNGMSACELLFTIPTFERDLKNMLLYHKSFNFDYIDNYGNSLLINCIINGNFTKEMKAIVNREKISNKVNRNNENSLIVASKLGVLHDYLFKNENINQQDYLGNTALYYAIKIRDIEEINMLLYNHADPNIKNYQGVSAMDLANEIDQEDIFEVLKEPMSPEKLKEKIEKNKKQFLFFEKKKSKDEEIQEKIRNHQIRTFREEYDYIKERKYTYTAVEKSKLDNDFLASCYMFLYKSDSPMAIRAIRYDPRYDTKYERMYDVTDAVFFNNSYMLKLFVY